MRPSRECDSGISEFIRLFLKDTGLPSEGFACHAVAGDGSKRDFWRIEPAESGLTYIAMENRPTDDFSNRENVAYLRIGTHLFEKGIPVPKIYRYDLMNGWFIMEDMGKISLQEAVLGREDRLSLYEKVVEILFRLQTEGSKGFDMSWTCQTERYDVEVMRRFETDYFREAFLHKYLGLKKDWPELEGPFKHLAERAMKGESDFFLHRDFQSRNIMVSDAQMGILDWQGGRLGPLGYDLASLIIDPYTDLSGIERDQVFQCYLRILGDDQPERVEDFQRHFPYLAIQRNLQILGAFAFLSKVRGKTYFEAYIPRALYSLTRLVDDLKDRRLSNLMDVLNSLQDQRQGLEPSEGSGKGMREHE
ncbi:MAG: phosphotransferase [Pseudomonadota bacterium]